MCKLCNVSDRVQRFYDQDDSSCKACKEHMGRKMIFTWTLLSFAVIFALVFQRHRTVV